MSNIWSYMVRPSSLRNFNIDRYASQVRTRNRPSISTKVIQKYSHIENKAKHKGELLHTAIVKSADKYFKWQLGNALFAPDRRSRIFKNVKELALGTSGIIGSYAALVYSPNLEKYFGGIEITAIAGMFLSVARFASIPFSNEMTDRLNRSIMYAKVDEDYAGDEFRLRTLEYGAARKAIAVAEVISDAMWQDPDLAMDLASDALFGLANVPAHKLKHVAVMVNEITNKVEPDHSHYEIAMSLGLYVDAINRRAFDSI